MIDIRGPKHVEVFLNKLLQEYIYLVLIVIVLSQSTVQPAQNSINNIIVKLYYKNRYPQKFIRGTMYILLF